MNTPENINPNIITFVPTTEQIRQARNVESLHNIEDAMSRDLVNKVLEGAGIKPPEEPPRQALSTNRTNSEPEKRVEDSVDTDHNGGDVWVSRKELENIRQTLKNEATNGQ